MDVCCPLRIHFNGHVGCDKGESERESFKKGSVGKEVDTIFSICADNFAPRIRLLALVRRDCGEPCDIN